MSKKKNDRIGVVYSTDPEFEYKQEEENELEDLPMNQQKMRVMIDRKQRKGKEVTLVTGFLGKEETLKELGKMLKSKCGVGGSVKEGEIIIQGNFKDKIIELLKAIGYTNTKGVGG